jgi:hypothetical protein
MARNPHRVQPIERFPAKPRRDGRFQKRINGILYYFGGGGNRAAALAEYERVKSQLYAGLPAAPPASPGALRDATVNDRQLKAGGLCLYYAAICGGSCFPFY